MRLIGCMEVLVAAACTGALIETLIAGKDGAAWWGVAAVVWFGLAIGTFTTPRK